MDRGRSHRAGRTRRGRAGDPRDAERAGWPAPWPTRSRARCRSTVRRAPPSPTTARIVVDPQPRRGRSRSASGWRRNTSSATRRRSRARLTRAGTVFVGHQSAQACGDYITGSNHVLPTSGAARGRGGLSAADFVRVTTIQTAVANGTEGAWRRTPSRWPKPKGFAATPRRSGSGECELELPGLHLTRTRPAARRRCWTALRGAWTRSRCRRSIPTTTRRRRPSPASSACPVDHLLLTNGLDEGILAAAAAACRDHSNGRAGSRRASRRRSTSTRSARRRSADGWSRCRSTTTSSCPPRTSAPPLTPRTRIVFLTNPHNPSGRTIPLDTLRGAREGRRAGHALRRRGVRGLLRRDADRPGDVRGAPEPGRRADVLQGLRPRGASGRRARRRARARSRRCAGSCRPTASTRGPRRRCRSRSRTAPTATGISSRRRRRGRCSTHACARLGLRPGRAPPTSCSCASATPPRVVDGAGGARRARPRSVGRPGLRAVHPHHGRTRRGHAPRDRGARGGAVRRAVIDRTTRETSIRAEARHRGARPLRRLDRHPLLRSHAGAGHAARRVRPDAEGGRRPRRRPAPHRRRRRHRARRSRRPGARHAARHQSRGLLRHADGRDAGRRGHRSRRPAARGRRSPAEGARASAISSRSSCRTSSRASRRARGPTST